MEEYANLEVDSFEMPAGVSQLSGIACSPKGSIYASCNSKVFYLDLERKKATVFAGGGPQALDVGHRLEVTFISLHGIGVGDDETVYVACSSTHRVFSIREDRVERFTGTDKGHKDGPRLTAEYNCPQRIEELNGEQYIADCWNHCVRKINKAGIVSTIGLATTDYLTGPLDKSCVPYTRGLCTGIGNTLITSSSGPHRISRLDFDKGEMELVAGSEKDYGDGRSQNAKFNFPFDVTVNKANGDIFVADDDNYSIRHIHAGTNEVHTFVGQGPNSTGTPTPSGPREKVVIAQPTGICLTVHGHLVWSSRDNRLRFITGVGPNLLVPTILLPSFETYLNDPKFSTHQVTLESGKVLNLVPELLALWDITVESVQALIQQHANEVSEDAILQLFRFIYAQPALIETKRKPLLAEVWYLSTLLFPRSSENSITVWSMFNLKDRLERSSTTSLINFAKNNGFPLFELFPACRSLWIAVFAPKYKKGEDSVVDALFSGDDALESLVQKVSNFSIGPFSAELRKSILSPVDTLTNAMEALVARISEFSSKPDTDMSKIMLPAPDFSFSIEGTKSRFQCHSWILHARWKYFSAMIEAGFVEAREMRAELPSDFSPNALDILLRFIYSGRLSTDLKDLIAADKPAAEQLLANAAQYRLADDENSSTETSIAENGFKPLMEHISILQSR